MKTHFWSLISAVAAFAAIAALPARADNMATIAIAPATGVVTLTPQWTIGSGLTGFHLLTQDVSLGGGANQFYSLIAAPIPAGGNPLAFYHYIAASGAATPSNDIGSKLTPNSYSSLTSASPDVGYGAVNFYTIHHTVSADYFTAIIPGSGTSSLVTDLKPMSGPGGPSTLGGSGYFSLTFSATDLGYGSNYFYYLRTDPVTGFARFGILNPALLGSSADEFNLGMSGFTMFTFTSANVGFGTNLMYYLRLDPITGFTIMGTLNPVSGAIADVANLGSVYSNVDFVAGDVGFGAGNFYATGTVNPTYQTVSFAAQINRAITAGSFTVSPSASSGLPVTLTVVPGSVGAASISGPVAGVFTVTPTAPGLITLQATQAGQTSLPVYEYNMLRQSFTITGNPVLAITTQPTSQTAALGTAATFTVAATGTTTLSYQWQKAGVNIPVTNASATTAVLTLPSVQASDAATYDVIVTDTAGSVTSNPVLLTIGSASPTITNTPLSAAATIGTSFSFNVTASGSPTVYTASPLPPGLSIASGTGAITGTPTTAGVTNVVLGATNTSGTGNATLVITVAASGLAPIITNSPLTAAGTVASAFAFSIVASGTPTSYSAAPLPAGLAINSTTGVISGTPTALGTTTVLLGATNGIGTGNATLTITVTAAGVAPVIANTPLTAAGNVGVPFGFTIAASGVPTTYGASPLPAGLSIVAATGAITGSPTAIGVTPVLLSATNAFGTGYATLTITIAAANTAPIITNNPLTAAATVGKPFSFVITATGVPTSYTLLAAPPGLSMFGNSGDITGVPTLPGTSAVVITATNAYGSSTVTLTIVVAAAGVVPVIANASSTAGGTIGSPFSFAIVASGLPTVYSAAPLPAGLSIVPATGVITGTPTSAGTTVVVLTAQNAQGISTAALTITVASAAVAPVITSPGTAMGTAGSPFTTYLISTTGLPTSYAATGLPAGLTLNSLTGAISGTASTAGSYVVTLSATNAIGTTTSTLTITVLPAAYSRIGNFSLRAFSGPATQSLVMGFIVQGNGKDLLVRGIGPTLGSFGISGYLVNPMLTLYSGNTLIGSDNGWGTNSAGASQVAIINSTELQVGAFLLPLGSLDSALLTTVNQGAYTASVMGPNGATGVALAEVYDTDTVIGAKLINVSARVTVGTGNDALLAGFVILGNAPKTVLIRGVGPTLAAFGITGVMPDPQITVFQNGTALATNSAWGSGITSAAQIAAISAQVGAFPLTAGSSDAALVLTLQPGIYSVQLAGVAVPNGIALIEIYDVM